MIKLTKRKLALIATVIFACIAATNLVVYALGPIWSQPSNPITITDGSVFEGTVLPVTWNGTNIKTTDTLLLSSALNPTPIRTQTVVFFYTAVVNASPATPVGTNPATSLVSIDTVISSGNTASTYWRPNLPQGTFTLFAEVIAPR